MLPGFPAHSTTTPSWHEFCALRSSSLACVVFGAIPTTRVRRASPRTPSTATGWRPCTTGSAWGRRSRGWRRSPAAGSCRYVGPAARRRVPRRSPRRRWRPPRYCRPRRRGSRPAPPRRRAVIHDIQLLIVGRKTDAVGLVERVGHHLDARGLRVHAVDRLLDFLARWKAFVAAHDAVGRVGEPDAAIGMHHDIVRRIQRLAVVLVGDHGHRAVMLVAHHAAPGMLAGQLAAFEIEGVAVRSEEHT